MWTSKKTKNTLIKIKAKALKIISTHNVLETKLVDIEMKSMPPFILITDCPALRSRGLPRPQRETKTYRQFYHSNILFSQKRHRWDLSPVVINPGIHRFSFRAQTKIVGSEGQRFMYVCMRLVKILELTLSRKAMKSGKTLFCGRAVKAAWPTRRQHVSAPVHLLPQSPVSHERGHS